MKQTESIRWNEFGGLVKDIRAEYGYHEIPLSDDEVFRQRNTVLFRGQSDSSWQIQTTLERKTSRKLSVGQYIYYASKYAREIEAFTGQSWDTLSYHEIEQEINSEQDSFLPHLPSYGYLVYLRQYGFPSPLLDWTESPYVAAFFAYWGATSTEVDNVSIYAYVDSRDGVRGGWEGSPMIKVMGPNVRTRKRHFAQKSWYTIATQWDSERQEHFFCPHERVFESSDPTQDILIKIDIPSSDRFDALTDLSDYNINPFTLFQTEEKLIKSIELKVFDLSGLLGE
jgi:hypothetical protein